MPINKDALKRFRIIDKLLSDPNHDYTTEDMLYAVNRECPHVSLRMIQKDINAIVEEFDKEIVRNAGGRGTVKYVDQSQPIFYKELTWDEEEVLREVLKSLGQFSGLDNFTWLELLKKKLAMDAQPDTHPLISFSKNDGLQIPDTLLGRLFTAISRKKVIRITYTVFGGQPKQHVVYPYQLKQYNDRWFLLCTPLETEEFPYNPEFIANFALDRISEKFDYVEDEPYIETPVDLQARFDEIIGVTLLKDEKVEDIVFAVRPQASNYVKTKYLHSTQLQVDEKWEADLKSTYPGLSDCEFFSIECRPNYELYSRFASYSDSVVLVEPAYMREHMKKLVSGTSEMYGKI